MRSKQTMAGKHGTLLRRAAAATLCLIAGCGSPDPVTAPPPPPPPAGPGSSAPFVVATAPNVIVAEQVTYFSLPPASLPTGTTATIRVLRTGTAVTIPLRDGGFDPVALHAIDGDSVAVTVQLAGPATPVSYLFAVPRPGRPIVIRTDPPPHKRDVALNAAPRVVFSQPIDAATLTASSVQVRIGGNAISAQLVFSDVDHVVAELTPSALLTADSDYELVVTGEIRDIAGNSLAAPVSVPFRTGPSVASVEVSPLVATIGTASNIPLTATLKNVAGTVLTGKPVTWTSNLPAVAIVTPNGLVIGMAAGTAAITAASEGITGTTTITVTPSNIAPLPGSDQIAFVRDSQIFLVHADGSGLVQLTATGPGVSNEDPAWSPDGQRLAFASNRTGSQSWDIYIMNADGSNVVRRTNGGRNVEPAWSPDGRTIVYTSLQNGSAGVFALDTDGGSTSRVILNRPGQDAEASWSPDGTRILYTSDWRAYDFLSDVYVMNPDGTAPRPLIEAPFFDAVYFHDPVWSRSGQKIALAVCPTWFFTVCDDGAIGVANADGSGLTIIAQPASGSYTRPTWSPDGLVIAFAASSCGGCAPSIRSARLDGSGERLVIANGRSPAWRP
jgi:hypothetical protein